MRGRDGNAQQGGHEQRDRAAGLGAKAPHGLELGDLLPHGLDDAPAAEHGAERNGGVAADDGPDGRRGVAGRGVARGDQQQPDDADGLLRVVAAVPQAVGTRGDELQPAKPPVHAARARAAEYPRHGDHHQRAEDETEQRREKDEGHGLENAGGDQRAGARLGHDGADDAADQRVRRAARDAVVPGDDVPGDGAHQGAEDDVGVHHPRLDDALADGGRHAQVEDEDGDEVEEGGEHHRLPRLEHAGGNHRGDRVGGIVEAVHEVEHDGHRDEQRHDPQGGLYGLHWSAARGLRSFRGRCPRSGWPRPRTCR